MTFPEFVGFMLIAWFVVWGFILNVALLLHWNATGMSPLRVFRRALRYGPQSQALLDELEERDEENE